MKTLVQEKTAQAIAVLNELGIDLWMTLVSETPAAGDPCLPLIYGADLTWLSALIFTRSGERIAILGSLEAETARRTGAYDTILPYDKAFKPVLLETLERLQPAQIALNYSLNDILADGLSHGHFLLLQRYLEGTPWCERLVSAEGVIRALRGRKTTAEIALIRRAVDTTRQIFENTFAYAKIGMTEGQISDFMHAQLIQHKVEPAWEWDHCPTVNSGPASPVGHVGPSEISILPGHILHIDYGVRQEGYCSDIQRVAYFLKPGEQAAPPEVQRGFTTVVNAIQAAVQLMRPGVPRS